jgi:hypothetical protein
MPEYMLLIYTPKEGEGALSPEEAQAEHPKWFAYTQALQEAGVMVAGDALQPVETATSVRIQDGETVVSDGPFAETKEVLGGYYIIDVPDLDEALKWAARMPSAPRGPVEVRPVMVFDDIPTSAGERASTQA